MPLEAILRLNEHRPLSLDKLPNKALPSTICILGAPHSAAGEWGHCLVSPQNHWLWLALTLFMAVRALALEWRWLHHRHKTEAAEAN